MNLQRVIPICAATAACALGVVPAASAATDVQQAASENWSGYVVGGSGSGSSSSAPQYKSVSGSWVAPTASCSTSGPGYSAFWVGLGGSGQSNALEQAGTEADCSTSGTPSYFAWYELVPSAPVQVSMAVHPGDHISSTVTVNGTNVTISLRDATTGGSFTKTLQMSDPDVSSAEWIAEAPSSCQQSASDCTPLSLADFGTVQFSNASATTTSGQTGSISDPAWSATAVSLSPSASGMGFASYGGPSAASDSAGATPSALSSNGSSFSVAWSGDASGGSASDTSGSAGSAGSSGSSGSSGYGYPGGGYGDGGYGYSGGGYGYGDGGYGAGGGYSYGGGYGGGGDGGYIYIPY